MTESSDPRTAPGDAPTSDTVTDADDTASLEHSAHIRELTPFGPVPVRYRHDGWVPDRQRAFIEALAECGCVDEAARAVGMNRSSAYALRAGADAQAFRLAWDAAMDMAVARLSDAALSRAIHGVAVPIFHGADQVGERRHFDERLTMFLLRTRDPARYGKWRDRFETSERQEARPGILSYRIGRMLRAAWRAFDAAWAGQPPPPPQSEHVADTLCGSPE
ncbi:hypothetical protein [Sphingomonas bacterium]|uniref:hypothetical protein n=1 Tax=Sphingomonas bacterium TaxID=1895847 RepID=UPI0026174BF2|nr:hypothetical protein [Sphingomonas bacterium]MDB5678408.1 hypothetical protein [Sphingomonas bacterium]